MGLPPIGHPLLHLRHHPRHAGHLAGHLAGHHAGHLLGHARHLTGHHAGHLSGHRLGLLRVLGSFAMTTSGGYSATARHRTVGSSRERQTWLAVFSRDGRPAADQGRGPTSPSNVRVPAQPRGSSRTLPEPVDTMLRFGTFEKVPGDRPRDRSSRQADVAVGNVRGPGSDLRGATCRSGLREILKVKGLGAEDGPHASTTPSGVGSVDELEVAARSGSGGRRCRAWGEGTVDQDSCNGIEAYRREARSECRWHEAQRAWARTLIDSAARAPVERSRSALEQAELGSAPQGDDRRSSTSWWRRRSRDRGRGPLRDACRKCEEVLLHGETRSSGSLRSTDNRPTCGCCRLRTSGRGCTTSPAARDTTSPCVAGATEWG